MTPPRTVESQDSGAATLATSGPVVNDLTRGVHMVDRSERVPAPASLSYLAEAAYERFWRAASQAAQAHQRGDLTEARRLTNVASAWLDRHDALSGVAA